MYINIKKYYIFILLVDYFYIINYNEKKLVMKQDFGSICSVIFVITFIL